MRARRVTWFDVGKAEAIANKRYCPPKHCSARVMYQQGYETIREVTEEITMSRVTDAQLAKGYEQAKTYLITQIDGKRTTVMINLVAFAQDLAKALGGSVWHRPENEYPQERQYVDVGADRLHLSASRYGSDGRVSVSIEAPDVKHEDRDFYSKSHKTVDATVSAERPIAVLAKDIKRRVIDANQDALALRRKYATEKLSGEAAMAAEVVKFRKTFPGLDVRYDENGHGRGSKTNAVIYSGGNGHYINASMSISDGKPSISIERLGSMSLGKFKRLVALLNEKE